MKDVIRWGIIGPGVIANTFAHCLREVPDAAITAVASRSIERSSAFCKVYGGVPYGSYEELANDPNVDIVYVATPHHLHEEHVLMCVRAGKAVLCEKPFAINEKQAANMYSEAEKAGVFIMEGLWSRFFPAWEFAKDCVQSGKYGKVCTMLSATSWGMGGDDSAPLDPEDRRLNLDIAGGALLDAGIYCLAAMGYVLGSDYPTEIKAISHMGPTGVDWNDVVSIRHPSGALFTMMCGLPGYLNETQIVMEKATIKVPRHRNPDHVVINGRGAGEIWGINSSEVHRFPVVDEGFQYEAIHAQDCLRKGLKTSPRVTPQESLMLIRISDEIRRQAGFVYPFEK